MLSELWDPCKGVVVPGLGRTTRSQKLLCFCSLTVLRLAKASITARTGTAKTVTLHWQQETFLEAQHDKNLALCELQGHVLLPWFFPLLVYALISQPLCRAAWEERELAQRDGAEQHA